MEFQCVRIFWKRASMLPRWEYASLDNKIYVFWLHMAPSKAMAACEWVSYYLLLYIRCLVWSRACEDCPKERPEELLHLKRAIIVLLLRICKNFFCVANIVALDSGFCVLGALVFLSKRETFDHALIQKREYWPKYIKAYDIKAYF